MKARNGKIARLPLEIREQLNERLADGEPANRLVEWLNASPGVMKVMAKQFERRPITNISLLFGRIQLMHCAEAPISPTFAK